MIRKTQTCYEQMLQDAYRKTIVVARGQRLVSVATVMNATGEDYNTSRHVLNRMLNDGLLTPSSAGYLLTPKAFRRAA